MASTKEDWCRALATELASEVTGVAVRKNALARERTVEVDLWVEAASLPQLGASLASRGFIALRSLDEGAHRFFLAHRPGGWCKVDAKLRGDRRRSLSNSWWAVRRRRGAIVALVGADGAGKSSTIETIHRTAPFGTHVAYLGWRRRSRAANAPPRPPRSSLRQVLGVGVWTLRTARRLLPLHLHARLGRVVLADRHPVEIQAFDGTPSRVARALRRFVARWILPRPDLILLLAAPGDLLYARKGEHHPDRLDEMTAAFRDMVHRRGGTEIDASLAIEDVVNAVEEAVLAVIAARM